MEKHMAFLQVYGIKNEYYNEYVQYVFLFLILDIDHTS